MRVSSLRAGVDSGERVSEQNLVEWQSNQTVKVETPEGPPPFKPYDHQIAAWDALGKYFHDEKKQAGILVVPTGGGKTAIAARWLLTNHIAKGGRVLWFAHRRSLLRQAFRTFAEAARNDDEVLAKLVEMTGLTLRKLANRLQDFDGRTRLRKALADELPLDYQSLCVLNVKQARAWGLATEIARVWEISDERVEEVLESVHGRTTLRRAFDTAEPGKEDGEANGDEPEEPSSSEDSSDEPSDRLSNVGTEWSRPRQMSGVLRALGFEVPGRLRSMRFQSVLEALRSRGIEACLADDPAQRALDIDSSSPGIAAKIRLRKSDSLDPLVEPQSTPVGSGSATSGWSRLRPVREFFGRLGLPVPGELGQEEFGALVEALELRGFEVATSDGSRLTPLHDAVSIDAEIRVRHDALVAPPPSLRTPMEGGRAGSAERDAEEVGDYERASLRLELLTAGGGPEHASPERITRCVEIAAAGLAIHSAEQALLGRVAEAQLRTFRDPVTVLTSLAQRLDAEDGEVLLREYGAVQAGRGELHALLCEHWAALCGPRRAGASVRHAPPAT